MKSPANVVIAFVPKKGVAAKQNLENFVAHSRNLFCFEGVHDFNSAIWPLGMSVNSRGRREQRSLRFSKFRIVGHSEEPPLLHENFAPFAKAYISYMQVTKPVEVGGVEVRLAALRALEQSLQSSGKSCPTGITASTFDASLSLIVQRKRSAGWTYRVGQALEKIASFLDENRLSAIRCRWQNYANPPEDCRNKIGEAFETARKKKLPKKEHLEALAFAFHGAEAHLDIVATSALALLLCQPSRLSEVLCLPVDCIVSREDGKRGLLLRWWPSKGGAPTLKPVPAAMTEVAETAVVKLLKASSAARTVAKFYEQDRTRIYLQPRFEKLRNKELLSCREVGYVLFGDSFDTNCVKGGLASEEEKLRNVIAWLQSNGIRMPGGQQFCRDQVLAAIDIPRVRFKDLEHKILTLLPRDFPIFDKLTNLKYSDALFVARTNELSLHKRPYACMIVAVQAFSIRKNLGIDPRYNSSLYTRTKVPIELYEDINMTSHKPRHFLDTIANAANMDSFDIAMWAGRKNVRQNDAYDHVSAEERAVEMRPSVIAAMEAAAPDSHVHRYIPIRRSDLDVNDMRSGHITDLGYCMHDFSMSPCGRFGEHINCEEHQIVKGDAMCDGNIRAALLEQVRLLNIAKRALLRGNQAARTWVETHERQLELLQDIVTVLDDPRTEDGSLIRLNGRLTPTRVSRPVPGRAGSNQEFPKLVPPKKKPD